MPSVYAKWLLLERFAWVLFNILHRQTRRTCGTDWSSNLTTGVHHTQNYEPGPRWHACGTLWTHLMFRSMQLLYIRTYGVHVEWPRQRIWWTGLLYGPKIISFWTIRVPPHHTHSCWSFTNHSTSEMHYVTAHAQELTESWLVWLELVDFDERLSALAPTRA